MAAHSSILAWGILWTEEPGGLTVHGVTERWARLSEWARIHHVGQLWRLCFILRFDLFLFEVRKIHAIVSLRMYIRSNCWILSNVFLALINITWFFLLYTINAMNFTVRFLNIEPSFHSWNKFHMVKTTVLFNATESFCTCIRKRCRLQSPFPAAVAVNLRTVSPPENKPGKVPCLFLL